MMNIAKTLGVFFGIWAVWVAWEFQHSIRSLTSAAEPLQRVASSLPAPQQLSLASPIPQPVRLPQRVDGSAMPSLPEIPVPARFAATAGEAAETFLNEKRAEWGVREYHELRPTTYESPMGTKVKYAAYQDGLPILGSEITLEVTQDRDVTLGENNYQAVKKVDVTQPILEFNQVLERAGRYQLDMSATSGVSKLLYLVPGSDEPELSYSMQVKENGNGPTENLIFRASDGQILGRQVPRAEFRR